MEDKNNFETFEQAMEKLEAIVMDLEKGDVSLEDALELYQNGKSLVSICTDMLDEAENKIRFIDDTGNL